MKYTLMLSSQIPPEETNVVAQLAEKVGFRRLWLTEDYYRKAAFASCASVLAAALGDAEALLVLNADPASIGDQVPLC